MSGIRSIFMSFANNARSMKFCNIKITYTTKLVFALSKSCLKWDIRLCTTEILFVFQTKIWIKSRFFHGQLSEWKFSYFYYFTLKRSMLRVPKEKSGSLYRLVQNVLVTTLGCRWELMWHESCQIGRQHRILASYDAMIDGVVTDILDNVSNV